jgi:hypothetical protein
MSNESPENEKEIDNFNEKFKNYKTITLYD